MLASQLLFSAFVSAFADDADADVDEEDGHEDEEEVAQSLHIELRVFLQRSQLLVLSHFVVVSWLLIGRVDDERIGFSIIILVIAKLEFRDVFGELAAWDALSALKATGEGGFTRTGFALPA